MARYHMIVNSGTIPVYRRSDCSGPCGELYPPLCDRPEELAVCRKSEGCCRKCGNLHPGRNSQSQRPGCNEIHQVYPGRYAGE